MMVVESICNSSDDIRNNLGIVFHNVFFFNKTANDHQSLSKVQNNSFAFSNSSLKVLE